MRRRCMRRCAGRVFFFGGAEERGCANSEHEERRRSQRMVVKTEDEFDPAGKGGLWG